ARDGVVDVAAVIEALDSGKLACYVTDFPTVRWKAHPKAACLPHRGAAAPAAEENCAITAAETLRECVEHGTMRNSVNFAAVIPSRDRPNRLAVPHLNVPNMISQISACVSAENININDMLNVSKGEIGYTLVDLDAPPSEGLVERIRRIDGVLS